MAAVTVSPQSQGTGDGEKLLKRIEQRARAMGLDSIFVLTTRTMHWFIKRGFPVVDPDWLPDARKRKYNWDRRSQVLVKKLARTPASGRPSTTATEPTRWAFWNVSG
jgi:amino-acid N-acetyltransferase